MKRALRAAMAPVLLAIGTLVVIPGPTVGAVTTKSTSSSSPTVWLCKPGVAPDPCSGNLSYTVVGPGGPVGVVHPRVPSSPPIDCFYVYPTVSEENRPNADLSIQSAEIAVAEEQVAPFSQDCRVFAPMYRQMTVPCLTSLQGLGTVCSAHNPSAVVASLNVAYQSLRHAFGDFLAHEPTGRHFVVIGHSQGAAMLIRLIKSVIDPNPRLRARLLSAIVLGGNLTVPKNAVVGGAFKHIPLCTAAAETHCAIAYSSFDEPPPANSNFGIPGKGVSFMWLDSSSATTLRVACVAPNRLLGQSWTDPRFRGGPRGAPSVTYSRLYKAQCRTTGNATYLLVTHPGASSGSRPVVTGTLGATWGLHLWDPNLTLGDLVTVVARESKTLNGHK